MRKTAALITVAATMMEEPTERHWGYGLTKSTGVRSGVLYPILERMLAEGWLEDGWEDRSEISDGRPPRRYYVLTGEGQAELAAILAEAQRDRRFIQLLPRPA
ncbi:MAG: helix-turn-helix transcriptional regulator [Thermoleophilaceae bacterium]